jgi:hypothetical protein
MTKPSDSSLSPELRRRIEAAFLPVRMAVAKIRRTVTINRRTVALAKATPLLIAALIACAIEAKWREAYMTMYTCLVAAELGYIWHAVTISKWADSIRFQQGLIRSQDERLERLDSQLAKRNEPIVAPDAPPHPADADGPMLARDVIAALLRELPSDWLDAAPRDFAPPVVDFRLSPLPSDPPPSQHDP